MVYGLSFDPLGTRAPSGWRAWCFNCIRSGSIADPICVENPKTSRAWLTEPILHLVRKGAEFFEAHYCQYNEPWRKATSLLCFRAPSLQAAFQVCTGRKGICSASGIKHLQLNGLDQHGVFWTLRAQAYPQKFSSAVALAIREQLMVWDSIIAPSR
mmetsp:Transcript_102260/g.327886  ORF Transcript_102260/g.327886 Transcript_102260/m.327886 type:complete len:156 (-) Transcript_102260:485-952(-)